MCIRDSTQRYCQRYKFNKFVFDTIQLTKSVKYEALKPTVWELKTPRERVCVFYQATFNSPGSFLSQPTADICKHIQ